MFIPQKYEYCLRESSWVSSRKASCFRVSPNTSDHPWVGSLDRSLQREHPVRRLIACTVAMDRDRTLEVGGGVQVVAWPTTAEARGGHHTGAFVVKYIQGTRYRVDAVQVDGQVVLQTLVAKDRWRRDVLEHCSLNPIWATVCRGRCHHECTFCRYLIVWLGTQKR